MKFITIKESPNTANLLVLKSRLESEGIRCRLKDEFTSQVLNYIPSMSVKLQVIEEDFVKTKEIMKEAGEFLEENIELTCPKCGSEEIKVKLNVKNMFKITSLFFISVLTLKSIGNIFRTAQFKCLKCGFEFINDKNWK